MIKYLNALLLFIFRKKYKISFIQCFNIKSRFKLKILRMHNFLWRQILLSKLFIKIFIIFLLIFCGHWCNTILASFYIFA